jgi:hypothetical protein
MKKLILSTAISALLLAGATPAAAGSVSLEEIIDINAIDISPDPTDLSWNLVANVHFLSGAVTLNTFPVQSLDACKILGNGMLSEIKEKSFERSSIFCINTISGEILPLKP